MLQMVLMRARCRRSARALQSYLDGELDGPTAAAVAVHLEQCRRCGLEAGVYRTIKAAIAAEHDAPTPVDAGALARLHEFARSLADPTGPGSAQQQDD